MKTKIKICGITSLDDALFAIDSGTDYLGLIFEPSSSRYVTKKSAIEIVNKIKSKTKLVGVFVNQSAEEIIFAVKYFGLYAVQLHNNQSDDFIKSLGNIDAQIWRVVWIESEEDFQNAIHLKADKILIDSKNSSQLGGTGEIANWIYAERLARLRTVVLAGGISPENVCDAINRVNPYALDLNSKLESKKGKKDSNKIKKLFENIKK